jgi:hypothetical protein
MQHVTRVAGGFPWQTHECTAFVQRVRLVTVFAAHKLWGAHSTKADSPQHQRVFASRTQQGQDICCQALAALAAVAASNSCCDTNATCTVIPANSRPWMAVRARVAASTSPNATKPCTRTKHLSHQPSKLPHNRHLRQTAGWEVRSTSGAAAHAIALCCPGRQPTDVAARETVLKLLIQPLVTRLADVGGAEQRGGLRLVRRPGHRDGCDAAVLCALVPEVLDDLERTMSALAC